MYSIVLGYAREGLIKISTRNSGRLLDCTLLAPKHLLASFMGFMQFQWKVAPQSNHHKFAGKLPLNLWSFEEESTPLKNNKVRIDILLEILFRPSFNIYLFWLL
jgi:hypothetical protein